MKAVIAIDSFKGHMSAEEAAEAAAEALRGRFGREMLSEVDILPASDGGEGFARIVTAALGGVTVTTDAHDPLGRPITASYGFCRDSATAVIECAAASGLTLLTDSELDPMRASSSSPTQCAEARAISTSGSEAAPRSTAGSACWRLLTECRASRDAA